MNIQEKDCVFLTMLTTALKCRSWEQVFYFEFRCKIKLSCAVIIINSHNYPYMYIYSWFTYANDKHLYNHPHIKYTHTKPYFTGCLLSLMFEFFLLFFCLCFCSGGIKFSELSADDGKSACQLDRRRVSSTPPRPSSPSSSSPQKRRAHEGFRNKKRNVKTQPR